MLKILSSKLNHIGKHSSSFAFLCSSAAPALPSVSSSSPYLSNLVDAILNSSTPQQALRIFSSASRNVNPAKTLKLHSAIVRFLVEAKLYVQARCLLEGLIDDLGKTRRPHKVCSSIFTALNKIQDSGCNANVFGVLIGALCAKGLTNEGYWVYNRMGKLPAVQACNALLNGILKSGQVGFVWEVYADMVSKGLSPSEVTYGILVNASCEGRDIVKAKSLVEEMIEKGLKTVVVYSALIRGLCAESRMSEAEGLFTRMQDAGLDPNLYTYNALLDGYAKMADVVKARKLYYDMLDHSLLPNLITYTIIIYLLCKVGELWAVRSYFVHMMKLNVIPNVYVYNCLMDGFCDAGDMSTAMEMYHEMEKFGISPDAVTAGILMKGYCRIDRVEDAENLLCQMNEMGLVVNSVVYNTLIDGYCKIGNMTKAVEICSEMVKKGMQPDIVTYCTLINGYCKVGQLEAAMGVYYEMQIKGFKPDVVVYTELIDGHFKSGYTDAALQLYKEMVDAGVASNVYTVSCVLDGLCKDGRINSAINFFLEQTGDGVSAPKGCQLDSNSTAYHCPNSVMYTILIGSLCKAGKFFKASKFFRDMRRNGLLPEVSDYIAIVPGHFGAKHVFPVRMLQADMLKTGILPNAAMLKVLIRGYQEIASFASAQKCCDDLKNFSMDHPEILTHKSSVEVASTGSA